MRNTCKWHSHALWGNNGCIVIGACRAMWVPGQDLATPHLMCNCRKRILSLHCTLYIRLCTHMLYAGDHVSSHLVLMIWVRMIRNNLGNARVCPGMQAPMCIVALFLEGNMFGLSKKKFNYLWFYCGKFVGWLWMCIFTSSSFLETEINYFHKLGRMNCKSLFAQILHSVWRRGYNRLPVSGYGYTYHCVSIPFLHTKYIMLKFAHKVAISAT